ncbi:hypothetical protein BH24DEI2_BH24DEI2_21860 [soil metagenome]
MVRGAGRNIEKMVGAWDGVGVHPHRFGGLEYRLGTREIGHVHGDRLVDVPFPVKVREQLVGAGAAELHHILPESGWGMLHIREDADVARAVALLERSYRLAVQQKARRAQRETLKPRRRSFMTTTANNNVTFGAALRAGLTAGIIAAVLNAIVYFIARAVLGGPLLVDTPVSDDISLVPILLFSLVPALLAGAVYWGLDKFLANPNPAFLTLAAVVFLAFSIGPITAALSPVTGWALEIMHGVVAVPTVLALLGLKRQNI